MNMQVKAIEPVGTIKQGEIFDVIEIIDQVYLLNNQNYYSQKHFMEVTSGITVEIIGTPSTVESTDSKESCDTSDIGCSDCKCDL